MAQEDVSGSVLDGGQEKGNGRKGRPVKGSRDTGMVAGSGETDTGKGKLFKEGGVCVGSTASLCAGGKGVGDRSASKEFLARGYEFRDTRGLVFGDGCS